MPLISSTGIDDPQDNIYGSGQCHIHAIASARRYGGSKFLVIEDHDEIQWQNPHDEDDYVPAVVHVYSLHIVEGVMVARDVLGDRLATDAANEAEDLFFIGNMSSREASYPELLALTQGSEGDQMQADGAENPLCEVTQYLIEEALVHPTVTAALPRTLVTLEIAP